MLHSSLLQPHRNPLPIPTAPFSLPDPASLHPWIIQRLPGVGRARPTQCRGWARGRKHAAPAQEKRAHHSAPSSKAKEPPREAGTLLAAHQHEGNSKRSSAPGPALSSQLHAAPCERIHLQDTGHGTARRGCWDRRGCWRQGSTSHPQWVARSFPGLFLEVPSKGKSPVAASWLPQRRGSGTSAAPAGCPHSTREAVGGRGAPRAERGRGVGWHEVGRQQLSAQPRAPHVMGSEAPGAPTAAPGRGCDQHGPTGTPAAPASPRC